MAVGVKLDFRIIPHSKQRYRTVGDYFECLGFSCFRVSRMKDRRYCWLVFAHEFIEWLICRLTGVSTTAIDAFDMAYEKARETSKRAPCGCIFEDEPGDDIHAPYADAHEAATACEKIIARALGIEWESYNAEVESL